MINVNEIRDNYPMFKNNPDLVYLDNAATAFKPQCVIDEVVNFYTHDTTNVHRGDYATSVKVSNKFDQVRKTVANFIHASSHKEIVFTSGTTQSLNWVAFGYGLTHLSEGDVILTTELEHASNILPWFEVAKKTGASIEYIPLTKTGRIEVEAFKKVMHDKVKIVTFAAVSNVLGHIQPIDDIIKIAHDHNAIVVIDGAQSVPHMPTNVVDSDIDFLAFSGHKLGAASGVGVLYGKKDLLDQMNPLLLGGGSNARFDRCGLLTLKETPEKFEAGTPAIEEVLSLGKAVEFLQSVGMDNIEAHEGELKAYAIDRLKSMNHIEVYNSDSESGIIDFNAKGIFAQDVGTYLNSFNIAVRSGNHCAKILVDLIGTNETVRASMYLYTSKEDIDRLLDALQEITLQKCIDAALF